MAELGTDYHESRVVIRKVAHHSGTSANLPVELFNDIVSDGYEFNVRWENRSKLVFPQYHPQLFGYPLSASWHETPPPQLSPSSMQFFLLGVDYFEPLDHQFYFRARCHRKYIVVEMDGTPLVFGLQEYLSHSLQHPKALVPNYQLYTVHAAVTWLFLWFIGNR